MKKIIFATIGLAMLAGPVAAGTPHSGYASNGHNDPSVQTHATAQERAIAAPAGTRSFGLTMGTDRASPQYAQPNRGQGVPYSAPPQGWPLQH